MSDDTNDPKGTDMGKGSDQGKGPATGTAEPKFKLEKGAAVTFHCMRSGGQVENFSAKVIGASKVPNAQKNEIIDIEFVLGGKNVTASEIKRGRSMADAPCWVPAL